jgi:hypothetical protein
MTDDMAKVFFAATNLADYIGRHARHPDPDEYPDLPRDEFLQSARILPAFAEAVRDLPDDSPALARLVQNMDSHGWNLVVPYDAERHIWRAAAFEPEEWLDRFVDLLPTGSRGGAPALSATAEPTGPSCRIDRLEAMRQAFELLPEFQHAIVQMTWEPDEPAPLFGIICESDGWWAWSSHELTGATRGANRLLRVAWDSFAEEISRFSDDSHRQRIRVAVQAEGVELGREFIAGFPSRPLPCFGTPTAAYERGELAVADGRLVTAGREAFELRTPLAQFHGLRPDPTRLVCIRGDWFLLCDLRTPRIQYGGLAVAATPARRRFRLLRS